MTHQTTATITRAALFRPEDFGERIAQATAQFLRDTPDYVQFAMASDPALQGLSLQGAADQLQAYPGVRALAVHQVAHRFYERAHGMEDEATRDDLLRQARWWAEAAKMQTGIDIHPGSTIDAKLFIDHGTGVVIGEKAVIGRGTRMYHDVTLGAAGKPPADGKRHPELGEQCLVSVDVKILGHVRAGNHVTFGPRVTVQGNDVTIADGVQIGAGAQIGDHNHIAEKVRIGAGVDIPNGIGLIDQDVPSFSKVSRTPEGALQFEAHSPSPGQDIRIGTAR